MATAETITDPNVVLEGISVFSDMSDEGEKSQYGRLVSYLTRTVKSGNSIKKAVECVQSMDKVKNYLFRVGNKVDEMVGKSESVEVIVKNVHDFHERYGQDVIGNFDLGPYIDDTDTKNVREKIIDAFKDQHRKASNDIIVKMITEKSVTAAVQLVKVYVVCKKISAASNVVEDETKFTQIKKNLKRLERLVVELVETCETKPEDKSIARRARKIKSLSSSIIGLIDPISQKLNAHISEVDMVADLAAIDVISNSITALSQGLQLWNVFDDLSSAAKLLGGISIGIVGIIGVTQVAVFVRSRQELKRLREHLKEANNLKQTLDDLQQQADAARDDLQADD